MQRDIDVLVAGAGPVGLFTAHALARKGVSVGIVDTGIWTCAHSYALALHPATVDLLCKSGLADDIVSQGHQIRRMVLYDEEKQRAALAFDAARPMVVLPQSALETEFENALRRSGVKVDWRHKVAEIEPAGDRVRVTLNRYEKESRGYVVARSEWALTKTWTIEVPFVVGADGYDSAVRHCIGARFDEVSPSSYYGVFEFHSDAAIAGEVRIGISERTTDVLWPLGGGWFRWSFQLADYVDPEIERLAAYRERYGDPSERFKEREDTSQAEINILAKEQLHEFIASRAPWFGGSVDEVAWRTVVRFERRLASCFGRDGCWLAGDSAHLGNPIGVHSLNVGLAEGRDLSAMMSSCLSSGHIGNGSLGYSARWQSEWKRLLTPPEALPDTDPWIREHRHQIGPCLPAYGENLTALAAQLGLRM